MMAAYLPTLRRDIANAGDEGGQIAAVPFGMHPFGRGRMPRERGAPAPLGRWPHRTEDKSAAAVRADVEQHRIDAIGAEGTFIAADPRLQCLRGKVLVAIFAIQPELEHYGFLPATRYVTSFSLGSAPTIQWSPVESAEQDRYLIRIPQTESCRRCQSP